MRLRGIYQSPNTPRRWTRASGAWGQRFNGPGSSIIMLVVATAMLTAPTIAASSSPHPSSRDTTLTRGLPLVQVALPSSGDRLAVVLTGDGGWARFDRDLAKDLVARGIAVIGFNLQDFLREQKTPDSTATAVWQALRAYGDQWHRPRLLVIGYSRGADVAPFVTARVPADLKSRLVLTALIAPDTHTRFHVTRLDLIFTRRRADDFPLLPQLRALADSRLLCIRPEGKDASACDQLDGLNARSVLIGGVHHFDGDTPRIAALIDQESVSH